MQKVVGSSPITRFTGSASRLSCDVDDSPLDRDDAERKLSEVLEDAPEPAEVLFVAEFVLEAPPN